MEDSSRQANLDYQGTEATTAPVAARMSQSGEIAFRFAAEAALDQGFITREGLEHVCNALYPLEVQA